MPFLPLVVRAKHCGAFRIHLVFSDNVEATVDFGRWLQGPIFEALKEPRYFARFFIDGGSVAWPNGADIAPGDAIRRGSGRGICQATARDRGE